MQSIALALAVGSTVAYHLVTKLVPAGANPIALLFTSRVAGTLLCGGIPLLKPAEAGFRGHFAQVNWTEPALAMSIVLIDFAFILLYRSGFPVSLGALVTNVVGVAPCLAGLWLVNRD